MKFLLLSFIALTSISESFAQARDTYPRFLVRYGFSKSTNEGTCLIGKPITTESDAESARQKCCKDFPGYFVRTDISYSESEFRTGSPTQCPAAPKANTPATPAQTAPSTPTFPYYVVRVAQDLIMMRSGAMPIGRFQNAAQAGSAANTYCTNNPGSFMRADEVLSDTNVNNGAITQCPGGSTGTSTSSGNNSANSIADKYPQYIVRCALSAQEISTTPDNGQYRTAALAGAAANNCCTGNPAYFTRIVEVLSASQTNIGAIQACPGANSAANSNTTNTSANSTYPQYVARCAHYPAMIDAQPAYSTHSTAALAANAVNECCTINNRVDWFQRVDEVISATQTNRPAIQACPRAASASNSTTTTNTSANSTYPQYVARCAHYPAMIDAQPAYSTHSTAALAANAVNECCTINNRVDWFQRVDEVISATQTNRPAIQPCPRAANGSNSNVTNQTTNTSSNPSNRLNENSQKGKYPIWILSVAPDRKNFKPLSDLYSSNRLAATAANKYCSQYPGGVIAIERKDNAAGRVRESEVVCPEPLKENIKKSPRRR